MKLNYRRTIFVGLAFMSISAFWQLYDTTVPLILKNTFLIGDTLAGGIMAFDNVLALFLLPLFGALSDRSRSRFGRRTPFIVLGTLGAVIFMLLIPLSDTLTSLPLFAAALFIILISMGTYRSPAVALMPDVTPKPLRSKANAVINLMGTLGGVYTLVMLKILVPADGDMNYMLVYASVAFLMVLAVFILVLTVREKQADIQPDDPPEEGKDKAAKENHKMPPDVRRSLILILSTVFLLYMGYNAISTAYTKYAQETWSLNIGAASTCLLVATGTAIASYIPIGILSVKLGRKKVILGGVAILAACFVFSSFVTGYSPALNILFALVGISWASINVNTYPMVVEMGRSGDVGKYTGFYYTFSMAAQIITPIASGALLEHVGYWTLFPYAALMVCGAFITMLFVRHGDSRPEMPKSKLEMLDVDD